MNPKIIIIKNQYKMESFELPESLLLGQIRPKFGKNVSNYIYLEATEKTDYYNAIELYW